LRRYRIGHRIETHVANWSRHAEREDPIGSQHTGSLGNGQLRGANTVAP
jgi:hypothetical protein